MVVLQLTIKERIIFTIQFCAYSKTESARKYVRILFAYRLHGSVADPKPYFDFVSALLEKFCLHCLMTLSQSSM